MRGGQVVVADRAERGSGSETGSAPGAPRRPDSPDAGPQHSLPWWRTLVTRYWWMLAPAALAFGIRVLVLLLSDVLVRMLTADGLLASSVRYGGPVAGWDVYDAVWYTHIARFGYDRVPPSNLVDFFPLYPMLIRALGVPLAALGVPSPYVLAGMIIAWASFIAACVLLYRLALPRLGHDAALVAVLLLALFPFSFFFGAPYTEAPYLLLAVGAFLAVEGHHWGWAAALAGLASALRPPGILIGMAVVLAYAVALWRVGRRRPGREALWLALIPSGLLAYCTYCWLRFGDFFAYQHASARGWHGGMLQWGGITSFLGSLTHANALFTGTGFNTILFALYALLAGVSLVLCVPLWRRYGPHYAFYVAAGILVPLATFPSLSSLGRYLCVLFPIAFVLADVLRRHPTVRQYVVVVSSVMLCAMSLLFLLWGLD